MERVAKPGKLRGVGIVAQGRQLRQPVVILRGQPVDDRHDVVVIRGADFDEQFIVIAHIDHAIGTRAEVVVQFVPPTDRSSS